MKRNEKYVGMEVTADGVAYPKSISVQVMPCARNDCDKKLVVKLIDTLGRENVFKANYVEWREQ